MGQGLRAVNHSNLVALWSERVRACRGSGLTVVEWCGENDIAVSSYYGWQRKLFRQMTERETVCFTEIPMTARIAKTGVATLTVGGLQVELQNGADSELIRNLVEALKLC